MQQQRSGSATESSHWKIEPNRPASDGQQFPHV